MITLCACVSTASAQVSADAKSDTAGVIGNSVNSETVDTVNTVNIVDTVDNMTVNTAKKDSGGKVDIDAINLDDDELLQAALAVDSAKIAPSAQKLDLIRRDYEYKRQTRAAVIMMIFIAVAMATSQSWNPR
jgi:alpha-L-arabinofuranosidase